MSEKDIKTVEKKQSVEEMEADIRRLELESKKLEVAEKKANLQDLEERLAERQLKRETAGQRAKTNAATLASVEVAEKSRQVRCTHKKGGNGLGDFIAGRGQSPQYAVIKHVMLNGDMWIRCLRCAKTWKPPIEADFKMPQEYQAAVEEYHKAQSFETNNQTSSSYLFRYSDGGAYSREVLRPTTLR